MKEQEKYLGVKKPRNHYPERMSDVVARVIKPVYDKDLSILNKLKVKWPEIVSEEFAKKTFPHKILIRKEGEKNFNTLVLEVYDNAFATLLTYSKKLLLDELGSYFGYSPFEDIKIVQKPMKVERKVEKPKQVKQVAYNSKIDEIGDEDLKKILHSLANFIEKDN